MERNTRFIAAGQVLVPIAGTAKQFPEITVPFNKHVTIKAPFTNAGICYIGNSKVDAQDRTKGYPLDNGEHIEYKIQNLVQLWVDSSVDGEGIVWTVEQEERK